MPRTRQVSEAIRDLQTIFKELAVLIIDQGSIIDRIDYNMEKTAEQTQQGKEELRKAERSHRRSPAMSVPPPSPLSPTFCMCWPRAACACRQLLSTASWQLAPLRLHQPASRDWRACGETACVNGLCPRAR